VSEKADSKFKVVSAASICAKVTRDYEIENWKFIENIQNMDKNYGSGYPSDPMT
jgi:ribonuclease H2 subunit A